MHDERRLDDLDARLAELDAELSALHAARDALVSPERPPEWTRHVTDGEIIGALLDRAPVLPRRVEPTIGRGACRAPGAARRRR